MLRTSSVLTWKCLQACALLLVSLLPGPLFAHPGSGILVDRHGQVYFVDTGSGLWKIDLNGTLIRITAPRFHWMTLDADDRFAGVQLPSVSGGEVARVGRSPMLMLASDSPLAMGPDGNLYYPTRASGGSLDLMRLLPSGGSAAHARIPLPWLNGLAAAPDGSLYYTGNDAIWRITAKGEVTAVATKIAPMGCATIPGTASDGHMLRGLAVDSGGTVYVAASGCGRVLKFTPAGEVTTVVQTESPWSPTAVALFGADLYVLEYLHTEVEDRLAWVPRVRKVSPDGRSAIIAKVRR